jgi:hypothetical protein
MSHPVVLSPEAKAEFNETTDWYSERRVGLGDEFINAVRDVLNRIRVAPEMYGVVWKDIRCALVRRFPSTTESNWSGSL